MALIVLLAMIFCVPLAIIFVVVACIYFTNKEKREYQKQLQLQQAQQQQRPSEKMDSERIKIHFRMDLMNRFIRKTFQNVKDWKVVGDSDGMHPQFFTSNIMKTKYMFVDVFFLDGTQKRVKVDTSKYRTLEDNILSLMEEPKPDNEQDPFHKTEKPDPQMDIWKAYVDSIPEWGIPTNQKLLKMYDEDMYEVRMENRIVDLFLTARVGLGPSINEESKKKKEEYREFFDMLFADIRKQEKMSFEKGVYQWTFQHQIGDMKIPQEFGDYPFVRLGGKGAGYEFHRFVDKNSIVRRDDLIKYTVKIPLNKDFWNRQGARESIDWYYRCCPREQIEVQEETK